MAVTDLSARFSRHVSEAGLFPRPGTALIAVSGGMDSVALLHLMAEAAPSLRVALAVGHVDHGIREDSHRVAEDIRALAAELSLPFVTRRLELGPTASETDARQARYRALRELQSVAAAEYLVTAHHADDQIETVLLRVLRGSGVAGLAGIAPSSGGGLVRPLLPYRRSDIANWALERGLHADVDPSNEDLRHDRSWVRTELLPHLRARFSDDVDTHLLAVAADADRNRDAWSAVLMTLPELVTHREAECIEVARVPLAQYHNVLSQTLLRACALEVGCRVGAGQAERLHSFAVGGQSGRRMDLGAGWRAELAFERLRLIRRTASVVRPEPCRIEGRSGEVRFGAWQIRWRTAPAGAIRRRGTVTWFPDGELVVRPWKPGDRVMPVGGAGSRKVRRVLMEGRVPHPDREAYPVVEQDGVIVWVPGLCRGSEAIPKEGAPAREVEAVEGTPPSSVDTTTRVDA